MSSDLRVVLTRTVTFGISFGFGIYTTEKFDERRLVFVLWQIKILSRLHRMICMPRQIQTTRNTTIMQQENKVSTLNHVE